MNWRTALCCLLVLMLVSCSSNRSVTRKGGYYKDDGPPKSSVDLSKVKDAVPRSEPLSSTGNKPYVVFGKRYVPMKSNKGFRQKGFASWYGKRFHGKRTSSGETYDMYKMTAAHTVLPIPSYALVSNLKNGRVVVVRVNDRGPFKHDRIMDLSYAAALKLDIVKSGTAQVEIVAISEGTKNIKVQTNNIQSSNRQIAGTQAEPTGESLLFIQLGAFSNQLKAYDLKKRLSLTGFPNAKVSRVSQSKIVIFRVRIGPLHQNADFILADLHHAGYSDAHFIVETN